MELKPTNSLTAHRELASPNLGSHLAENDGHNLSAINPLETNLLDTVLTNLHFSINTAETTGITETIGFEIENRIQSAVNVQWHFLDMPGK